MWTCLICQVTIPSKGTSAHLTGDDHLRELSQGYGIIAPQLGPEDPGRPPELTWTCTTCNRKVLSEDIETHLSGEEHQWMLGFMNGTSLPQPTSRPFEPSVEEVIDVASQPQQSQ